MFEEWFRIREELTVLENNYLKKIRSAYVKVVHMESELQNTKLRLNDEGFDDEIRILNSYKEVFERELRYVDEDMLADESEYEIDQPSEYVSLVKERTLHEHLENLFREMTLDLETRSKGAIAISGFTTKDEMTSDLITLLNELAVLEVSKHPTLYVVERDKLDMVLQEQKLALSDLIDTTTAIEVGKLLSVSHILTGTVIEMPGSVVIFGRVINVETGEIDSAAQVIVPMDKEVEALL